MAQRGLGHPQLRATDIEEWRIVQEAPDYAVSSIGRVMRIKPDKLGRGLGNLLRTPLGDAGYPVCSIHVGGKQHHRRVYKLVCTAFHGPKPSPKHEVRHLDGNNLNTRASNLVWGTSAENKADTLRHGMRQMGERHSAAKLTASDVVRIRASSAPPRTIAAGFGISYSHVIGLRSGKGWEHSLSRP